MSEETPPEWLNDLPEPLRAAPFLSKAKDAEDAVGKLAHAAQLVGTSVRIPSEDAAEEVKADFYAKLAQIDGVARLPLSDDEEGLNELLTKLGKPNEYTEYKLPDLEDFEWDEDNATQLRKYALEAGMTNKQFDKMARQIAQQELDADTASENELEVARKELRTEWGDTLEERESLIRGWLEHSEAPESMRELFEDKNLPLTTMNWLYQTAKQFKGNVNPITRDGKGGAPTVTPAEAREKIAATIADMTSMRETDPRYEDMKRKLVQLHRLANPQDAA